ncbi:unnamed protein product [Acanthoscelides obtectus]|uniref:Uncharacterized protein n=1 Tax=Acanthoscelides obtectus TaxID=200917 RepID=A0A9P0KEA3_ACAOB|nr:unnamed protein product [Acanthoscelides obtectus]CAK1667525.1 hypothetical protein AOBTE_LOCUS25891 [Acanthoscelides obtectus]
MPPNSITFHFHARYRALATAISVTGTSIGIMAFPIIINNLFHHLEWRMEFRILAGSFGMIMLLVLIFKPIKPTRVVAKKGTSAVDLSSEDEDSIGSFDFGDVEEDKDVFTLRKIFQNFHNKFFPTMSSNKDSSTTIESKGSKKSAAPSTYFGLPGAIASEASVIRSVFRGDVPEARSVGLSTIYETDDDTYCCCCCRCCRCCKICRCKSHLCQDDFNRPLYRDDIFYTGSIKALPEYRSRVSVVPSVYSSRAVKEMASLNYTLSVSRVVTQRELQQARRCVCCPEAVLRVLSTMLDLKLMKQLSFALLVLSGFFTMVGLYSPFVFIGQRGEELGFTANWNTLLLTIMGISNTVGRIICGVVSTIPRADVMLISWSTLVIAGAATMASAFAPFLEAQIAFSVTYGLLMVSLHFGPPLSQK